MKFLSSETGSALIYILIAVVLFAVLAAAISRTNRGGVTGPGAEITYLQATEILQYARGLRTAAQTMQINGATDTQVSFDNSFVSGYTNGGCTADSCHMFLPDGGEMSYVTPDAKWLDSTQSTAAGYGNWLFSGANAVNGVGTDDSTAAASDLVAILPYVQKSLCLQLNTMLGIANPNGDAPKDSGDADLTDKFIGSYSFVQGIGGGDPQINRQRAACFQGGGNPAAGTYHFYQVLIAR